MFDVLAVSKIIAAFEKQAKLQQRQIELSEKILQRLTYLCDKEQAR